MLTDAPAPVYLSVLTHTYAHILCYHLFLNLEDYEDNLKEIMQDNVGRIVERSKYDSNVFLSSYETEIINY